MIFDLFGDDRPQQERDARIRSRVLANQVDAYQKGFTDGVLETLAQIAGHPGARTYEGPVPDELRDWIGKVRDRA